MSIDAAFAGTNLRWGLLLEDHPEAYASFRTSTGTELGIPTTYGGEKDYVVATIHFVSRPNVEGYKAMGKSGDDEDWNKLCTQALGRALKRAGYPDKLTDLKAMVLWRQRRAEIDAVAIGHPLALAAPVEAALDAAETHDPDDDEEPVEVETTAGEGASQEAAESEPSPVTPSEDETGSPVPPSSSEPSSAGRAETTAAAPLPAEDTSGVAEASRGSGALGGASDNPEVLLAKERAKLLITSLTGQKSTKAYLTYRREHNLPLTVEAMSDKQVAELISFLEPLHATTVPA